MNWLRKDIPSPFDEAYKSIRPSYQGEGVVIPTEYSIRPFAEVIRGRKGGYLGVSTHQNFTLAAVAESELAIVVDRSSVAIDALTSHREAHLRIDSPKAYVDFWCKKTRDIIAAVKDWHLDSITYSAVERTVFNYGEKLGMTFYFDRQDSGKDHKLSWLASDKDYQHIKHMFEEDKFVVLNADLQDPRLFQLITDIARKHKTEFNVLYLSNVEDHLGGKIVGVRPGDIQKFWRNLESLPLGKNSAILRTIRSIGNISPDSTFHYVSQQISDFEAHSYQNYEELLADIGEQITQRSMFHTKMPVPESDRDHYIQKMGWTFP